MDKLLAVLPLDFPAIHHCIPTDLARLGGPRVRVVYPRAEVAQQPFAFRRRWRVESEQDAAALLGIGGSQPAHDKKNHLLLELVGLVETNERVRPAAIGLLVARVLASAELDLPTTGQVTPDAARLTKAPDIA